MMTPVLLFLLLLAATSTSAKATGRSWVSSVKCFADTHQSGRNHEFNEAVPHLGAYNLDNDIESVKVTGMWIFYDNADYNTHEYGRVFWAHGIEFEGDVPYEYRNMATSLRYAGSADTLNEGSWTVYEGTYFTGEYLYGFSDAPDLDFMSDQVSSIILTGPSSWTFYDGPGYTGNRMCLRPDTYHDNEYFQRLDLGIYTELNYMLGDNRIRSVHMGCWDSKEVRGAKLEVVQQNANGAMGYIRV